MRRTFVYLLLLLTLPGCGSSLLNIEGKVTLNGVPVEQGEIRFIPSGGDKAPSAAAIIAQGHYKVDVAPGTKRIEILGYKVVGQRNIGTMIDIKEQIVPERYNTRSELTCSIESADETHDFELQ